MVGVNFWVFVILVLFAASSSARNWINYHPPSRYGYHNDFGSLSRGPPSKYYAPKPKLVSLAPFCTKGYTTLKVVVVEEHRGQPAAVVDALVHVTNNRKMDQLKTDSDGSVCPEVSGCSIGVMVKKKGYDPAYTSVDLNSCTTNKEKVVVTLNKICDFPLDFSIENLIDATQCQICGGSSQLVSYIYSTSSGYSGHGQADSGSQICIKVGSQGQTLEVMLNGQFGNVQNILKMSVIDTNRGAIMALPPKVDGPFDILVTSNTFEDSTDGALNPIRDFFVVSGTTATEISKTMGGKVIDGLFSFAIEVAEIDDNQLWMISLRNTSPTDPVNLKGSIVLMDYDGSYQTVEHPTDQYTEDYWHRIGCLCNGPSLKDADWGKINTYNVDREDGSVATICGAVC